MKKEEVVQELAERFNGADTSDVNEIIAIQVDLKDEDGGTLYLEVKDNVLSIEPYEYYDRNAVLTVLSKDLLDIIDKKLDPAEAISNGILNSEGDYSKALYMLNLAKPKVEEKVQEKAELKADSKPAEKAKSTKSTSRASKKTASKTTSKSKAKAK